MDKSKEELLHENQLLKKTNKNLRFSQRKVLLEKTLRENLALEKRNRELEEILRKKGVTV